MWPNVERRAMKKCIQGIDEAYNYNLAREFRIDHRHRPTESLRCVVEQWVTKYYRDGKFKDEGKETKTHIVNEIHRVLNKTIPDIEIEVPRDPYWDGLFNDSYIDSARSKNE